MKTIENKCKLCAAPVVTHHDKDASDDYIRKLAPLVTCNRCFDLRSKFKTAESAIFKQGESLLRFALLRLAGDELARRRQKVRETLTRAVQSYAEALAAYRKVPTPGLNLKLIDALMANSANTGAILRAYRKSLWRGATPPTGDMA